MPASLIIESSPWKVTLVRKSVTAELKDNVVVLLSSWDENLALRKELTVAANEVTVTRRRLEQTEIERDELKRRLAATSAADRAP